MAAHCNDVARAQETLAPEYDSMAAPQPGVASRALMPQSLGREARRQPRRRTLQASPERDGPRGWAPAFGLVLSALALVATGGCASVRLDVPRPVSHALEEPSQTSLGRAFAAEGATHPALSGVQIVDTGAQALQARAALADAAERTLDLQYYSVGDDRTTDLLLQRIAAAAERGVRVRILLDDIHPTNRDFVRRATALVPGVEARLFNPFVTGGESGIGRLLEFLGDSERLNRRMHNKLWVADNAVAIVGGRNLGDEYFDSNAQANFSDLDLLAVGPVVSQLSSCFDDYWNSSAAVPFAAFIEGEPGPDERQQARAALDERLAHAAIASYRQWIDESGLPRQLRSARLPLHWARAQAACDRPDKAQELTSDDIRHTWPDSSGVPLLTKSELIVVTPYFIPSEKARQHLADMRRRSVRVAVLTNSLISTDAPAAHAGYARYRGDLLRIGVELFELRPQPGAPHPIRHRWRSLSMSSLHAKIVIVDRARAIIGSNNQDPRSRRYNTESWITIESPELAADMVALFEDSIEADHAFHVVPADSAGLASALRWITEDDGKTVRYDSEPGASTWLRFWSGILSVLVPEDLL